MTADGEGKVFDTRGWGEMSCIKMKEEGGGVEKVNTRFTSLVTLLPLFLLTDHRLRV